MMLASALNRDFPGEAIFLDTLAAAQARAGLFKQAEQTQAKAIDLWEPRPGDTSNTLQGYQERPEHYRQRRPWSE